MTPSERRAAIEQAVRVHDWDVPAAVVERIVGDERFVAAEQIEAILILGFDIAGLRGKPLSVEILEPMLAEPDAGRKAYPDDTSAIIEAIECGLVGELRRAVARRDADLEEISDHHEGMTPLLLTLFQRDLMMAGVLVTAGADVNNRGRYPDAPIHLATCGAGSKRLQLLLDAGADPDSRDGEGRTPLMLVAEADRHLDKVQALLAAGADASLTDPRGVTALAVARLRGAHAIAGLLDDS